MSKNRRSITVAAAIALAASSLAACTVTSDGTPRAADLNVGYTGPALEQRADLTDAEYFAPGVELSVGVGSNAVTCTAGWILQEAGVPVGVLTAGQCGRSGPGSPVSFMYKGERVNLGHITETSFKDDEEFNTSRINIALIAVNQDAMRDVLSGAFAVPSLSLLSEAVGGKSLGDAKSFASHKNWRVCWIYKLSTFEGLNLEEGCGTVSDVIPYTGDRAGDGKLILKPDKGTDLPDKAAYGAPVTFIPERTGAPVGIVTDIRDGKVIVDTFGAMLDSTGLKVANRVGR